MVKNVGVKNSREKSTIPVIICILCVLSLFRINMTTPGIPDEDEDVDDISQVVFKPTFGKQPRFYDKAPDAPAPSKYK